MVGCLTKMSLSEGQDQLLFLGGDREIGKRRRVPNDVGDIIHRKFNFGGRQLVISSCHRPAREEKLTP